MNALIFLLAIINIVYALLSIARLRYLETRMPASLIAANLMFVMFYPLGYSYQALNSINHETFRLAYATFYYDKDALTRGIFALFQYIAAIEIMTLASLGVYKKRLPKAPVGSLEPPAIGFLMIAGLSAIVVSILVFRIVTTVGIPYFIKFSILRSVFFEGLGVPLELLFVVTFVSCVMCLAAKGQRKRWVALFIATGVVTLARWPLIVLALGFVCYLFFVRRRRFLQVKYAISGFAFVLAAISIALLTRPSGDTWEGPLQVIYGTEQAPQIPALLIAENSRVMESALSSDPLGFVGEIIPRQLKSVFGFGERATGNQVFTRTYWGNRLRNDQSEISFGGLNELYFRGGFALILGVLMLAPLYYGTVLAPMRDPVCAFIAETAASWFFFQMMRSDLAHTFSRFPSLVLGTILAIWLVKSARRAAAVRRKRALSRGARATQAIPAAA